MDANTKKVVNYYKRKYPKMGRRKEKQIRLFDDEWALLKRLLMVFRKGGAEKCREIMKDRCLIWAMEELQQEADGSNLTTLL